MYQALYREHRPEVFDDILGQKHIVKILKNQLATNAVSHAYLFCGTRGTGKTSTARILAKGLNCLEEDANGRPCGKCANCEAIRTGTFMDVIEIDAASNNGVDNIRELRESVKYPPAMGRKKVYIIDEVHMLSTGAANALLKTLEEPPEHVIFILATTEPHKLLATIMSRCMRLDFKRVSEKELLEGMMKICTQRGIEVSESALRLVVENADGSVRDGLSILDQCIASGEQKIDREDILEFLGTLGEEVFMELTDYVKAGKSAEALLLIDRVLADGKDVKQVMKDWLAHYRTLLLSKFIKSEDVLNMSTENISRMNEQAERMELVDLNNAIVELSRAIADAKWSTQPRILLELCIVKMATGLMSMSGGMEIVKPSTIAPASSQVVPQNTQTSPSPQSAIAIQDTKTTAQARNDVAIERKPEDDIATQNLDKAKNEAQSEAATLTQAPPMQDAAVQDAAAQDDAAQAAPTFDLEELWYKVFEEGETDKASLNIVRAGTRLAQINDNDFLVIADSDLKRDYANENREFLESLMERFTGKYRLLKCMTVKEAEAIEKEKSQLMSETNEALKNLFGGLEVTIK